MTPVTKTARHARIAAILAREQVRSQEELAELLERYASVHVTQATLSRDLDELGVVRLRATGGALTAHSHSMTSPASQQPRRTVSIAVVGAGGVGGYFAGALALAGQQVHLLARGSHLDAIRAKGGLEIVEPDGEYFAAFSSSCPHDS